MRRFLVSATLVLAALVSAAPSADGGDCRLLPGRRANLERCAWGLVGFRVGQRGSFVVHFRSTADYRMTYRVDDEPVRDATAPPCIQVSHECPSCAWRVTGPYPAWRVQPE